MPDPASPKSPLTRGRLFETSYDFNTVAVQIQKFPFTSGHQRPNEKPNQLFIGLAPAFNPDLNLDQIDSMPSDVKVMIAGVSHAIYGLKQPKRSWTNLLAVLSKSPFVQPLGHGVDRNERIGRDFSSSIVKLGREREDDATGEVEEWMRDLVHVDDEDVLKLSGIDEEVLKKIVRATRSSIGSFMDIREREKYKEFGVLDVTILRYPDERQPYFKAFHIVITGYSGYSHMVSTRSDNHGLIGEFSYRKFKPRESVICKLKPETTLGAINDAKELLYPNWKKMESWSGSGESTESVVDSNGPSHHPTPSNAMDTSESA